MVPQKTKVIEEALQLLYQHWLVLQTTDAALWTTLADHFPVWIQIIEVAKCWVVMTKTLQEQLMDVLLVTAAPDVAYALTVDEETVTKTYRLRDAFVFWTRMLHLCPSPATIIQSAVFLVVQQGLHDMVNDLIAVTKQANTPDGNDLFDLFFDAVALPILHINHEVFFDGVVVAMKSVVFIYRQLLHKTLFTRYLPYIVFTLDHCLRSPSIKVVENTIVYMNEILTEKSLDLLILLPSIADAIGYSVEKSSPSMRIFAIKLIRQVQLLIAPHALDEQIPRIRQSDPQHMYRYVQEKLLAVTLDVFKTEDLSDNVNEIFKVVSFYLMTLDHQTEQFEAFFSSVVTTFTTNSALLTVMLSLHLDELLTFLALVAEEGSTKLRDSVALFQMLLLFLRTNKAQLAQDKAFNGAKLFPSLCLLFARCFDSLAVDTMGQFSDFIAPYLNELDPKRPAFAPEHIDVALYNGLRYFTKQRVVEYTNISEAALIDVFAQHGVANYADFMHVLSDGKTVLTLVDFPWLTAADAPLVVVIARSCYAKTVFALRYVDTSNDWVVAAPDVADGPFIPRPVDVEMTTAVGGPTTIDIASTLALLQKDVEGRQFKDVTLREFPHMDYAEELKHPLFTPAFHARLFATLAGFLHFSRKLYVVPVTEELLTSMASLDDTPTLRQVHVNVVNADAPSAEFLSVLQALGTVHEVGDKRVLQTNTALDQVFFHTPLFDAHFARPNIILRWNAPIDPSVDTMQISVTLTPTHLVYVTVYPEIKSFETTKLVHMTMLPAFLREIILAFSRETILPFEQHALRTAHIAAITERKTPDALPLTECLFTHAVLDQLDAAPFAPRQAFGFLSNQRNQNALYASWFDPSQTALVDNPEKYFQAFAFFRQNAVNGVTVLPSRESEKPLLARSRQPHDRATLQPTSSSGLSPSLTSSQRASTDKKKFIGFFKKKDKN